MHEGSSRNVEPSAPRFARLGTLSAKLMVRETSSLTSTKTRLRQSNTMTTQAQSNSANRFPPQLKLTYSHDSEPGFHRRRCGTGFSFLTAAGETVKDSETRERLKSLAVPPAYERVWYCADPRGHLQATGYDSKGRKQYRYHSLWQEWRQRKKFDSLSDFGHALPAVRAAVDYRLGGEVLDRDLVLAAVVKILDRTAGRIGNTSYKNENGTTGLTTLEEKEVEVRKNHLLLSYTGKGGISREFNLYQPTLSRIVSKLQDLPGQRLFKYRGNHGWVAVDSGMVNSWLKEKSGIDISAKDFRTWHASRITLEKLTRMPPAKGKSERLQQEKAALLETSRQLGHRPPVCRKHYVHPEILNCHRLGELVRPEGDTEEERLLRFLKKHPFGN